MIVSLIDFHVFKESLKKTYDVKIDDLNKQIDSYKSELEVIFSKIL